MDEDPFGHNQVPAFSSLDEVEVQVDSNFVSSHVNEDQEVGERPNSGADNQKIVSTSQTVGDEPNFGLENVVSASSGIGRHSRFGTSREGTTPRTRDLVAELFSAARSHQS